MRRKGYEECKLVISTLVLQPTSTTLPTRRSQSKRENQQQASFTAKVNSDSKQPPKAGGYKWGRLTHVPLHPGALVAWRRPALRGRGEPPPLLSHGRGRGGPPPPLGGQAPPPHVPVSGGRTSAHPVSGASESQGCADGTEDPIPATDKTETPSHLPCGLCRPLRRPGDTEPAEPDEEADPLRRPA